MSTADRRIFATILAIQTLLLAFILASFPVRNADFFSQLAGGRLIANGEYQFGVYPFAYTTDGTYWANHAWLFELMVYTTNSMLGNGIVFVKAAFVVAVAVILLSCRRPGSSLVLPAVVTAVALFAMSPRLLLNSTLASVGFLAATVVVLIGPRRVNPAYAIPFLMASWVNFDSWFILGPLTVALVWVGERVRTPAAERRVPTWLVFVAVAACLASPHHLRALALPLELSPTVLRSPFPDDPRFRRLFEPSWRWQRYTDPADGLNAGGIGYLALMLLGLVSFWCHRAAVRSERALLWLVFAGLALWNHRLGLFFAVVGGPVAVLNLQDYFATRQSVDSKRKRLRWLGQGTVCLLGLALLALSWIGWLQAPLTDVRKVGWEVQPDPGLMRGAQERAAWRTDGRLASDERAFHTHPDSAAYAAWFAPGEKCFLDARLKQFVHVATEYTTICQAAAVNSSKEPSYAKVEKLLRDRNITYVVLHDSDLSRVEDGFSQMARPGSGTILLQISGREATFGLMSESRSGKPFTDWRLDVTHDGFRADGPVGLAPATPTDVLVEATPRTSWTRILTELRRPLDPPRPRPAAVDEAGLYLRAFQAELQASPAPIPWTTPTLMAALFAASAPTGGGASALAMDLVLKSVVAGFPFHPGIPPSPSATFLAIRVARAAVAAAPNDPLAHFRLGQAYVSLSYATRENAWAVEFRPLAQLRHVQAVFALERAVALDPDLAEAHALLVQIYHDRRMLDAALTHLREQARIVRARAKAGGTIDSDEMKQLTRLLTDVESVVQERKNEFTIRAPGLAVNPVGRTRMALSLGLTRTALDDVLLVSEVIQFGADGAKLELELLLMLGRTARLREELNAEEMKQNAARLGTFELPGQPRPDRPFIYSFPAYDWFRLLAAAGNGDHTEIDAILADFDARWLQETVTRGKVAGRAALDLSLFQGALALHPETWPFQAILSREREALSISQTANRLDIQVRADLRTLAGVLALERGDIRAAEGHFRMALRIAESPEVERMGFTTEAMCRTYLGLIEAARVRK